ncbi:uncharacterized protein V1516DRAFT_664602 [Lipomyces oligophaga]|uniref:uncharacterized protein n=1 Tax=Lipomyces oligophaga TaxID=45792 RepID=UPI0034CE83AD
MSEPSTTNSHPLQSSAQSTVSENGIVHDPLEDGPGSPIIGDFDPIGHSSENGDSTLSNGAVDSTGIDEMDYDESGDEDEPLLRQPQPRKAFSDVARRLLPNGLFGFNRATSPSISDEESAESAAEADLLLPSPSETSAEPEASPKRWGTSVTRFVAYGLFGLFFIMGWKLVFLPRTTLRRDLARIRHYKMSLFDLERLLFRVPDAEHVRQWSEYYTSGVHLAGTNESMAQWTAEKFKEYGIKSEVVTYHTLLNYPVDHSVSLIGVNGKLVYEASLEEDMLPEDPTSMRQDRVPTFHGYSANGNVTGEYIYVNYGRQEDYELLESHGLSLKGRIVIARYGGLFRGLIVKGAEERGAIGVITYSDPGDDGEITIYNRYKAYPDGPARNPSSVQRGSVQYLSIAPGDPTTPGYASKEGVNRQDPKGKIPSIPSIPMSYGDILPILRELSGMGLNPNDLGESWRGGLREYDYSVGPSTMVLNLYNEQDYKVRPIWNTIGRIDGIIKDEVVIIGNHRDAWILGGAGDPNSGSAVLIELARAFGELQKNGWKPLRSIILASWDGEEYGLLGSTEWGEEMANFLGAKAFVYLNTDVAVSGTKFSAGASPLLNTVLKEVTKRVSHPEGGYVYDHWYNDSRARIEPLGSGSDYTVFQDHLGIPSLDIGFGGGDVVYQYHSNYDSFAWMDRFGDPTWQYHVTMVKLWGLLTLELCEREVAQFDVGEYVRSLNSYFDKIKAKISDIALEELERELDEARNKVTKDDFEVPVKLPDFKLGWWYIGESLDNASEALITLDQKAAIFDTHSTAMETEYVTDYPWFKAYKKIRLYAQIAAINRQYMKFERQFLYSGGLDGREWFKHVVFAPGIWTGYAGAQFPALDEALDARNITATKKWLDIITNCIQQANRVIDLS